MNRSPGGESIALQTWSEALGLLEGCKFQDQYSEALNHLNRIALSILSIDGEAKEHFALIAAKEYMWLPKLRRDIGTALRIIIKSYRLDINIESLESFR